MKAFPSQRSLRAFIFSCLTMTLLAAMPLAAQESATDAADTPTGLIFRWLNFALVFGGLAYAIGKFGGPFFRGNAAAITSSIREATEARAAAERELQEAARQLASLDLEVQDLRRAAVRESASETARIRDLARVEAGKIAQAAQAEIQAAERAARQELRSITARLATERAAAMVREQITAGAAAGIFHSFVGELRRSAP